MDLPHPGGERINSFALVTYIPDPLASFLNELREELEPGGLAPRAHVTLLPPRPLFAPMCDAVRQLGERLNAEPPIDIVAGEICMFPVTNVIYISLSLGAEPLTLLHGDLNREVLHFDEPFPYSPHITLAQGHMANPARRLFELARCRWAQYTESRGFRADSLVFVQNTLDNQWLDLAEFRFQKEPARVRSRKPA